MFYEDDVAGFFRDFGKPATLSDGAPVTVIFDKAFFMVTPMGIDIESTKPQALIATTETVGLVHGSTIKIENIIYTVVGIEPDGTGITLLNLKVG